MLAADRSTAADLAAALQKVSLNPDETYRVRELQFSRGDIKVYLTEGVLSFLTPVAGQLFAAVFTTEPVEAGDAEIIALPPQRSERSSLASFTNSPNMDEHFNSAVLFFSDSTAKELLSQIKESPIRKVPDIAAQLSSSLDSVVRDAGSEISVRLIQAFLDDHRPEQGFFYALVAGRTLGSFDVLYEPNDYEPVSIGRPLSRPSGAPVFQLWTAFRSRRAASYVAPSPRLSNYSIDTTIRPDLSMSALARFSYIADASDGRVITLALSDRLKVSSAAFDGGPIEVFQPASNSFIPRPAERVFLLISSAGLKPASQHKIEVQYEGSVIRQTEKGGYFVDERNLWYPHITPMLTNFDLTFRFPPQLTLVSTGDLVSDNVVDGVRVVHRQTHVPEALAGFNLGNYKVTAEEHGPYRVECYSNRTPVGALQDIAQDTENLLDYFTHRWIQLPIHSLAVSPIGGAFGQGFPGLIYLSTVAYIPSEDRPTQLRNPRLETFSEMLLPHEVAHQWWGNIVVAADYRTGWLIEAMANYSALQFLEAKQGKLAVQAVLDRYRADLMREENGKAVETAGPVDWGVRLLENRNASIWHTIIYEKGTWVLHMLRERLGEDGFNKMQMRLLQEFAAKPITNQDFQKVAAEFVPAGQPDRNLAVFFDSWIYGTGIPHLTLGGTSEGLSLDVSGVDDDFVADVPLICPSKNGDGQIRWVRASSGSNPLDLPTRSATCSLPSTNDFLYSH